MIRARSLECLKKLVKNDQSTIMLLWIITYTISYSNQPLIGVISKQKKVQCTWVFVVRHLKYLLLYISDPPWLQISVNQVLVYIFFCIFACRPLLWPSPTSKSQTISIKFERFFWFCYYFSSISTRSLESCHAKNKKKQASKSDTIRNDPIRSQLRLEGKWRSLEMETPKYQNRTRASQNRV